MLTLILLGRVHLCRLSGGAEQRARTPKHTPSSGAHARFFEESTGRNVLRAGPFGARGHTYASRRSFGHTFVSNHLPGRSGIDAVVRVK